VPSADSTVSRFIELLTSFFPQHDRTTRHSVLRVRHGNRDQHKQDGPLLQWTASAQASFDAFSQKIYLLSNKDTARTTENFSPSVCRMLDISSISSKRCLATLEWIKSRSSTCFNQGRKDHRPTGTQISFLSQFIHNIDHISGKDNTVLDELSTLEIINTTMLLDLRQWAIDQANNPQLQCW